jgi:hypothetical protein
VKRNQEQQSLEAKIKALTRRLDRAEKQGLQTDSCRHWDRLSSGKPHGNQIHEHTAWKTVHRRNKIHSRLGAVCSEERSQADTQAKNREPKILAAEDMSREKRNEFAGPDTDREKPQIQKEIEINKGEHHT